MERTVHRILGETSVRHVRAAGLSAGTLTLLADSPAWATVARFRVPDICDALREDLPRIRDARVILAPVISAPVISAPVISAPAISEEPRTPAGERIPAADPHPLSPFAARVLRSVARTVENPRLSRVLMRLAARERPPAGPSSASESPSPGVNRR